MEISGRQRPSVVARPSVLLLSVAAVLVGLVVLTPWSPSDLVPGREGPIPGDLELRIVPESGGCDAPGRATVIVTNAGTTTDVDAYVEVAFDRDPSAVIIPEGTYWDAGKWRLDAIPPSGSRELELSWSPIRGPVELTAALFGLDERAATVEGPQREPLNPRLVPSLVQVEEGAVVDALSLEVDRLPACGATAELSAPAGSGLVLTPAAGGSQPFAITSTTTPITVDAAAGVARAEPYRVAVRVNDGATVRQSAAEVLVTGIARPERMVDVEIDDVDAECAGDRPVEVRVTNSGDADEDVSVRLDVAGGAFHRSGVSSIVLEFGELGPGESRRATERVDFDDAALTISADVGSDSAEHEMTRNPIGLELGPHSRAGVLAGQAVTFDARNDRPPCFTTDVVLAARPAAGIDVPRAVWRIPAGATGTNRFTVTPRDLASTWRLHLRDEDFGETSNAAELSTADAEIRFERERENCVDRTVAARISVRDAQGGTIAGGDVTTAVSGDLRILSASNTRLLLTWAGDHRVQGAVSISATVSGQTVTQRFAVGFDCPPEGPALRVSIDDVPCAGSDGRPFTIGVENVGTADFDGTVAVPLQLSGARFRASGAPDLTVDEDITLAAGEATTIGQELVDFDLWRTILSVSAGAASATRDDGVPAAISVELADDLVALQRRPFDLDLSLVDAPATQGLAIFLAVLGPSGSADLVTSSNEPCQDVRLVVTESGAPGVVFGDGPWTLTAGGTTPPRRVTGSELGIHTITVVADAGLDSASGPVLVQASLSVALVDASLPFPCSGSELNAEIPVMITATGIDRTDIDLSWSARSPDGTVIAEGDAAVPEEGDAVIALEIEADAAPIELSVDAVASVGSDGSGPRASDVASYQTAPLEDPTIELVHEIDGNDATITASLTAPAQCPPTPGTLVVTNTDTRTVIDERPLADVGEPVAEVFAGLEPGSYEATLLGASERFVIGDDPPPDPDPEVVAFLIDDGDAHLYEDALAGLGCPDLPADGPATAGRRSADNYLLVVCRRSAAAQTAATLTIDLRTSDGDFGRVDPDITCVPTGSTSTTTSLRCTLAAADTGAVVQFALERTGRALVDAEVTLSDDDGTSSQRISVSDGEILFVEQPRRSLPSIDGDSGFPSGKTAPAGADLRWLWFTAGVVGAGLLGAVGLRPRSRTERGSR